MRTSIFNAERMSFTVKVIIISVVVAGTYVLALKEFGKWNLTAPSLALMAQKHTNTCSTNFLVDSKNDEVIFMMRELNHEIELTHIPWKTEPAWKICYGQGCLPLSEVATYIITKNRK